MSVFAIAADAVSACESIGSGQDVPKIRVVLCVWKVSRPYPTSVLVKAVP
jgi:hypothetical protein